MTAPSPPGSGRWRWRWSDLPVDRPVGTLMLLVSLVVLGVVGVTRLPLDFMPMVKEPEVDVRIPFPGSQPLEGLREVARPIEAEVATVPGVTRIRSNAGSGYVNVEADFDWSTDMALKTLEVKEAVERARPLLPDGIGHVTVEVDTGEGGSEILEGRISAERNLSESWDLLDRRIRRPLERVRGVARVSLYGVERQQVRVDLDLPALERHGIGPREVIERIQAENVDLDLGAVHGDVLRYEARVVGRFRDVQSIRDVPLGPDGVRVRDVARVAIVEPRLEYGRHLDRRFAIGIDVMKEPSANTVETVDRLLERIEEIENDPELQGITLLVWENAGEEIRTSLEGLRNAGTFGGLLAVFVLFFFLRRVATTLVIAVAIPFSIVVTCGAMYLLGAHLNVLSMMGLMLGVGMLVDNAVVVMENIHRRQAQGLDPAQAAKVGTREVLVAVVASTMTTLIVWSWLWLFDRNEMMIYISEVALAICLAVICSLVISLTFIPLAASRFAARVDPKEGFLVRRVVPGYRSVLDWTIRHRKISLPAILLLGVSWAIPAALIERSDEPQEVQRDVMIRMEVHDASSKEVLEGYIDTLEEWLESRKAELGYESIYSWYSEQNGAQTRLYLARDKATKERLANLRKLVLEGAPVIPGVTLRIGDFEWWRQRPEQGRRRVPVAVRGDDPEYLDEIARDVEERLRGLEDVTEVYGPSLEGQREVRVLVDPDRARALGVTPRLVAATVATAFRGRNLKRFLGDQGELEVVLGLPEDAKPGLPELSRILVPRDEGGSVPLTSVATIEQSRTPPRLQRENRATTTWISAEFDEKAVTTQEARARVTASLTELRLPEGYGWSFGNWGERRDQGTETMKLGLLLSVGMVVILMMAIFESFSQPMAILVTLALAFFGAFWSLWLLGHQLDPTAFIGLIILVGIVVNNGIVMVDHVNALRGQGMERRAALLQGCGDRFRPVLMTAITTIFGLLPLALSAATVAGIYIDGMAVALIGGLTSSTCFTLLALPVWYCAVEDVGAFLLRLLPRRAGPAGDVSREGVLVAGEARPMRAGE